jgi:hypothetical protein
MKELDLTDWTLLILLPLFLLSLSRPVEIKKFKDNPDCFPDYRPGYECMGYEKLPY